MNGNTISAHRATYVATALAALKLAEKELSEAAERLQAAEQVFSRHTATVAVLRKAVKAMDAIVDARQRGA
jgi:hypothetical protein